MLTLARVFLVVATIAAAVGFGLVGDLSYDPAKVLFYVFLALAGVFFVAGAFRGPTAKLSR